ncbi:DUF5131 family protein [Marinobacter sp. DS40M6]|uniref:DUF5131 family protein n=1 Tax=Marinobacter sp. DS40M6 TaxID=1597776 RepID=UPI00235A2F30|nr:phage Gp37/Gp68 family protein [Marinobacter sp. DS40M6]MDC8456901.1 phage Gp37/Gp68 family protein [Marinobacter sp. DS40M6]
MGIRTGIEWTESTWNPIRGCSRVSEGCRNCYAETVANRFKGPGEPYEGLIAKGGQWNGTVTVVDHKMYEPLRWTKPRMIFVNSMSDLFHPNVPESVIDKVFAIMALAPRHTFQILTKRPERMHQYLMSNDLAERIGWAEYEIYENVGSLRAAPYLGPRHRTMPLDNVWIGVSVENQATANERIPVLLDTQAAIRWISAEPLLGPIDLSTLPYPCRVKGNINWVVAGGESGFGARPMHPDWPRTLRDQCLATRIPFLFKQWGEWGPKCGLNSSGQFNFFGAMVLANDGTLYEPGSLAYPEGDRRSEALAKGHERARLHYVYPRGKKVNGRELDGRTWDQYPEAAK